jgi:vitamin B12 transporter
MFRRKMLAALAPLCLSFVVLAEDNQLDPIVVTAARQTMRASEALADVTVLTREDIEKSGQETIIDLLSRQPGVQITRSGGEGTASSLYLRGSNWNQTKILIDGVAINNASGNSPQRFLPLEGIERIEILRGPASMLYGADSIGGVIQIITRRGKSGFAADAFAGYGSHGTHTLNAGVSAGNDIFRLRAEAHHYQTDGISSARHTTNKDADDDAYRNTGGAVSFSVLPAAGHEIGLALRKNQGVAHYDSGPNGASNLDFRNRFTFTQWRLFSRNKLTSVWTSEISLAETQDKQKDFGTDWAFNDPDGAWTRAETKNRHIAWQNDVDLPLGRLLAALEWTKQTARANPFDMNWNTYMVEPTYDHTPEMTNRAGLIGWRAALGKHQWQLNARHDRHSGFGGKTTYGAAYGYRFSEQWLARASYGSAYRAPTLDDLYRPGYGGNHGLKPEKSKNAEIGLTWTAGPHQVSGVLYRNRIRDMITSICDAYWVCHNENINKALLTGATLGYRLDTGDWRLDAAYDWLDAENESHDPADNVGYERLGRRAKHKATLALTRLAGNWEAGVEVVGTGKRYDLNYKKNAASKKTLGGFGLINLTARYRFTRNLALEGRLNNLTDKKYEYAGGYNTDGGFNAFVGLRYVMP